MHSVHINQVPEYLTISVATLLSQDDTVFNLQICPIVKPPTRTKLVGMALVCQFARL